MYIILTLLNWILLLITCWAAGIIGGKNKSDSKSKDIVTIISLLLGSIVISGITMACNVIN